MTRVLIVDDNLDAAYAMAFLIEQWGYDVRVVEDGESAIEKARAWRPQLVLLDIGLPGMDGFSVAQWLRREDALLGCRIIAMSAFHQASDRARLAEAGIGQFMRKPIDLPALRRLLDDSRPPPANGTSVYFP